MGLLNYIRIGHDNSEAYHGVSEGHLWFSIFSRPPSNTFTRVRRCACYFVLFFPSMLLNITYYDLSNEVKTATQAQIGGIATCPVYITPQQVYWFLPKNTSKLHLLKE
ncbi:unnamed protein product [Adineta steineri]|uniref:Uncharacterized protein n=1 Tax=Adineta steineri TaxID=433720 RepID=A0A819HSR2_9BILA|nr:unnamed protein product [Adineta steineri]CAF3904961.1 unnamed protein product [Adineta steineri]